MMDRRLLLGGAAGLAVLGGLGWTHAKDPKKTFEIVKSDDEWRKILGPMQYKVLREHGTERPHSSPLNHEKRKGIFACAGCDLPLFASETKFESGTGWPSFYQPLQNAVGTAEDRSLFMRRIEVHCRRCGGHLGHVFDDGPKPTGLRYCMNGIAHEVHPGGGSAGVMDHAGA